MYKRQTLEAAAAAAAAAREHPDFVGVSAYIDGVERRVGRRGLTGFLALYSHHWRENTCCAFLVFVVDTFSVLWMIDGFLVVLLLC